MTSPVNKISKEMGYTRDDFMRLLPKAVGHADMEVRDDEVLAREGDGKLLRIEIGPESERKIGFFRIPKLPVTLQFSGYSEPDVAVALERFGRAFQKGGG